MDNKLAFYDYPETQKTTFLSDFNIASHFGKSAITDTYRRAMREWKNNIEYITEIVLSLNMLCWHFYGKGNEELSELFGDLYGEAKDWFWEHAKEFSAEERSYFFEMTD